MSANQKKKHHYVPVTYLSHFADKQGRVCAYRKDEPKKLLYVTPDNIAFERYYYSQPLPEGGQDNNTLEDLFSKVEETWPSVVKAVESGQENAQVADSLFQFISLLRVRTPAARDPIERFLAHQVLKTAKLLERTGRLPQAPPGLENLLDKVHVSIDPHMSIHAMPVMMKALTALYEQIGFEVVHNDTSENFITSDNPVSYFDPDVSEAALRPYTVTPGHRVEYLLPLTSRLLLRGRSELPKLLRISKLGHVRMTSATDVRRVNRMTARFAYNLVIAQDRGLEDFVTKYADLSPGIAFEDFDIERGLAFLPQMVFAARPKKPKWKRERTNKD